MVSCSVRWKRIAFSMAIAQGSTRVRSTSRSLWVKRPPSLLMISTTPMVRPREMRGAQRIERVLNWVLVSNRGAKRGSFWVSFTIVGLPVWATQPAIPSPILIRNAETSFPLAPRASSKASSCFSSSTISMDQASEGMSCWIFSMISSITLRGSRMELAVLTMSVRMARRLAVRRRASPTSRRRPSPLPWRALSRRASTAPGGGSPGRQASIRKSRPSRSALRTWLAFGRWQRAPTGRPGTARRTARTVSGPTPRPISSSAPSNGPLAPTGGDPGPGLVGPGRGKNAYSRAPRSPLRRRFKEGPPHTATRATSKPSVGDHDRAFLLGHAAVDACDPDHHHRFRPHLERDVLVEGSVGGHVDALAVHGEGGAGLGLALHLEDVPARLQGLEVDARRGELGRPRLGLGDPEEREVREASLDPALVDGRDPPVVGPHVEAAQLHGGARPPVLAVHQEMGEGGVEVELHMVAHRLRHRLPGEEGGRARGIDIGDLGLVGRGEQHGDAGEHQLRSRRALRADPHRLVGRQLDPLAALRLRPHAPAEDLDPGVPTVGH